MALKLNTGKIAFPIEFDNGDTDIIYFNPNDPNFFKRLSELEENVSKRLDDIKKLNLNAEGVPEVSSFMEQFEEVREIIYAEIDYAFGGDISKVVFKYCSPFAIVNGDYFLAHFINSIRPEIEKQIKKAKEEVNKKIKAFATEYKK